MRLGYWVKLLALAMALTITVISIMWLKQGHMPKFLGSIGLSDGQMLNWCDSRVKTMTLLSSQNVTITEEAGKWLWKKKSPITLNYLSVEKWLAKYCQLSIQKIEFKDFKSPMNPLLEVEFISGENLTFYDLGKGRIQVQNHIFSSPSFKEALKELLAFGPKLE